MKLGEMPAFPKQRDQWLTEHSRHAVDGPHSGMTLRQYYAGLFMAGLIANPARYEYISGLMQEGSDSAVSNYKPLTQEEASTKNAHKAVMLADALLAELEKQ